MVWDLFYGLRMTQDYQLDHLPSLRLLKPLFANVLLELGRLPHNHILPLTVHMEIVGVILSHFYPLNKFHIHRCQAQIEI